MASELEQPDDPDAEPTGGDELGVHNTASGVVGAVVQAGVVHGGVHLHAAPPQGAPMVPRQLPAAPALFAGRVVELSGLDRALASADLPADVPVGGMTVVVSAIGGAGGIGKTWLALAWAHRRLDRFPDGQLFVDLHGFSPAQEPMTPAVAVRGFLDALGVDPGRIPADLDAQTALYRSLVAGKRMLVVLDNAADAEQVTPLLPGGDSCTVVVTSRRTLLGLITRHGAHHLALDTLTDEEAHALLARRLGARRVAAESDAVAELVALCGGFPLALGIIAGRAHAHRHVPLTEFAAELRGLGLGALEDDDPATSLPAVLSWSYRALTAQQQVVFGLLGIAPGPDIGLPAVASLIGLAPRQAVKVLRDLQEASLLSRDAHGRYSMHDLIRYYAVDTADHELPEDLRTAAFRRVVDFYTHTAHTADLLIDPHRQLQRPDPPAPGCHPQPLPAASAALTWFDTEYACLLAAQRTAAAHHRHRAVWHLAWTLTSFQLRRGHRRDRLAVLMAGLDAAKHLHEPATHALAHRLLGAAHAILGQHDEAIEHLHKSLSLAEQHNDHIGHAHAQRALAWAWGQSGDDRLALEHATSALNIFRTLEDPLLEAQALNDVGWCAAQCGDHDQALQCCQTALALFRRHQDLSGEANVLDSLGYIAHHSGRHDQAIRYYRQAISMFRSLGDDYTLAISLDGVGHSHTSLGQHDQARTAWREALELYREQGRDEDAERVQRQIDDLGTHHDAATP